MLDGRVVAQQMFSSMVKEELRRRKPPINLPAFACRRSGISASVIDRVVEGKPELCKENELRRLIRALFKPRSWKRNKVQGYIAKFTPQCGVQSQKAKYNNRRRTRRGRIRFAS
jgi:hypothetical protein